MTFNEEAHVAAYQAKNRRLAWVLMAAIGVFMFCAYLSRGVIYHQMFK